MSTETNKKTIRTWFDAVNRGDEQSILALLTDDFVFKAMARSPEWIIYRWTGQEFAAAPKSLSTLLKTPIIMEIVGMIGEDNEVTVEAQTDAELKNGKRYNNAYHFVFVFRDGLISEVREYCCSHLVEECFGEFNPNNPSASRANP
jgi:ketosteroid isomerase-like protein